ncbi:MAG: selenide, water dikinase SelD [Verrucomicrobiales bacterium]|nr:selenide, water dikinase SelD [Verrucomicrobiales bacterium]
MPANSDANLLVGSATSDDAAVYQIAEDRALVQTVDFFTPIVDDPELFGRIAATNSLSDVYAMGGRPLTAMNLLAVPEELPLDVVNAILRGGAEQVKAAGAVLAGGHSVKNPEPLYGLSVTGLVHPQRIISNAGGQPGDRLVLTKPLGTGILSTALKRERITEAEMAVAVEAMSRLNTPGARVGEAGWVRGGTDVTGFGLLGHLGGLCRASGVRAVLDSAAIPVLSAAVLDLIREGCVPGGTKANLRHAEGFTEFSEAVDEAHRLLLADAQTSGGLLLCVPPQHLRAVMEMLAEEQTLCAAEIGRLEPAPPGQANIVVS